MDKQEFLDILESALKERISQTAAAGHVAYYRNYIEEQIRSGKSESEILDMLGDPRLIARTLSDTAETGAESRSSAYDYEQDTMKREKEQKGQVMAQKGRRLLLLFLGIAIVLGILAMLVSIVSFVLPIVLPVAAVLFLLSYFRRR